MLPTRSHHARRLASAFEPLEQRRLLAAITWDGGGDGTNWSDPLNWSTNELPTAADDVTIDVAGGSATVQVVDGFRQVGRVTCAEVLRIAGGTLETFGVCQIPGTLELAGGMLRGGLAELTVTGLMRWTGGELARIGPTTIAPGGSIVFEGGVHDLRGELDLNGNATWTAGEIVMRNATLTNTGAFTANASTPAPGGGPALVIRGAEGTKNFLINTGTITKTGALEIMTSSATVPADGGAPTTLFFNNNGSVVVSAGRFTIDSEGEHFGAFNVPAGAELQVGGLNRLVNALSSPAALVGAGTARLRVGLLRVRQPIDFDGTVSIDPLGRLELWGDVTKIRRLVFEPSTGGFAGRVNVIQSSSRVVRLRELVATGDMVFDLEDNNLIIDYDGASPLPRVRQWLEALYGSSSLTGGLPPGTLLGYAEASDVFTSFPATFAGQNIDNTTVLVRHTLLGDADLDRRV